VGFLPQFAGDVNGDGTNDYLFLTPSARDERTLEVLEDKTGKTALFYGGTPSEAEDQLFYTDVIPAGDLNGDGYDDAIRFQEGEIRFVKGSTEGYADTGTTISDPGVGEEVIGFTDIDGDGIEDALICPSSRRSPCGSTTCWADRYGPLCAGSRTDATNAGWTWPTWPAARTSCG
jgi:hypothetical protein